MSVNTSRTIDESTIRDLVENWARAVRARNLDGILANHSPEILMFDLPPPIQSKGIEAYKKTWDLFYSCAPDPAVFDITEMNVNHIPIWRESTLFSETERAALEWTEAVTKLSEHGVPDEVYDRVRAQLSETQISELTFAVAVINAWNRLNISFRTVPGSADEMLGLTKAGLN